MSNGEDLDEPDLTGSLAVDFLGKGWLYNGAKEVNNRQPSKLLHKVD